VHRAAPGHPHTDGTDLSRSRSLDAQPHSRVPRQATSNELELYERVDHDLLDTVDVIRDRARAHRHVQDRVGNELAGAVVSDVATAVGTHDLGPDHRRVHQHM
jgi:hypothetical protein